jgi:hypothetical protein
MPAFIYKKNIKCYKCSCATCGADRGFQPIRNIDAKCVNCSNKSRKTKSEAFKAKMSIIMRGNKNGSKPESKKLNQEQLKLRKSNYNKKAHLRNKDRYKNDIEFRLRCVLRARLNVAIRNNAKTGSAVKQLGCSITKFKEYMESKFQPGMKWDNWSTKGWHIDHVVPLSSFNLSDPEQLAKACHYTNLQPLWAKENISKGGANASMGL